MKAAYVQLKKETVLPMIQQLVKGVNVVEAKVAEWAHWGMIALLGISRRDVH